MYLFTRIHSQVVGYILLFTCLQLQHSIFCSTQLSCFVFLICLFLFSSLRLFNEEALKDYEHFRKQEVRDLKEVLAAHIKTQIILCKLVCRTPCHESRLIIISYNCISIRNTHLLPKLAFCTFLGILASEDRLIYNTSCFILIISLERKIIQACS